MDVNILIVEEINNRICSFDKWWGKHKLIKGINVEGQDKGWYFNVERIIRL